MADEVVTKYFQYGPWLCWEMPPDACPCLDKGCIGAEKCPCFCHKADVQKGSGER